MDDAKMLCSRIREVAYAIHVYLGHGHLEKVYENALANRLRKAGFAVAQQHPITVFDEDGTLLGSYAADLLVNNEIIVELKAARALASDHYAQILGYLKASRLKHGMLINFGAFRFEVRKFVARKV
jgi:GxxExxY protein